MVSRPEGFEEVEKMRGEASSLRRFVSFSFGDRRDGWEAFKEIMDAASDEFEAEDTTSDDGAFILYTSGTTKHPKGVLHTHGYTHAKRMQAEYWLDLQEGVRLWYTAGTAWAKSIWNAFLGPWSLGTELFFHEGGFDSAEQLGLIRAHYITVLCQAPRSTAYSPRPPSSNEPTSPRSGSPARPASR